MKKFSSHIKVCLILAAVLTLSSCATYYQMNYDFQRQFQSGNLEQSLKYLDAKKKAGKGKDRFLYFVDKATVCNMLGRTALSKEYFRQADIYAEDFQRNYGTELLALVTNPMVKPYKPEDFENVMLQYYQAKNYLLENNYDAALVEAKRLNEKLLAISDINKKRISYKRDAFGHLLIGLIYDANRDANNAFIAYRNAYNVYVEDYSKDYGVQPPEQLKKDILRTAAQTGLWDEVNFYEKKWNTKYVEDKERSNKGDVIVFWHNGLGPVKSEWSINFTILPGEAGMVTFVNEEWGMTFPFYVGSNDDRKRLIDLKIIRVAIPKFVERVNIFEKASLSVSGQNHLLELSQDINKIAVQNLKDRIWRELGVALLRVALKQAAETAARQSDKKGIEGVGFAIGIINAITEKADTRNWQTLPHDIYYTRISLPPGNHEFTLQTSGKGTTDNKKFVLNISRGRTVFHTAYSLDAAVQRY
jgi:uncharacterized protein